MRFVPRRVGEQVRRAGPAATFSTPLLILLFSWPAEAGTDPVGDPLFRAWLSHWFFANLLLGVVEGWLLARLFKAKTRYAMFLMIAANYATWAIGTGALMGDWLADGLSVVPGLTPPLHRLAVVLGCALVAVFLGSVLLTLPFCLSSLKDRGTAAQPSLREALRASAAVQLVSFAVLVPLYASSSTLNVPKEVRIDSSLSFARPTGVVVYYIGKDGDIYRLPLGAAPTKVLTLGVRVRWAKLFVERRNPSGPWDLWVRDYPGPEDRTLVKGAFATHGVRGPVSTDAAYGAKELMPKGPRHWGVWAEGSWGLIAKNRLTGEKLHLTVYTPILGWYAKNATLLPEDQVVFQFGDQIALLDLRQRTVGVLAMGRGPVAVVE